MGKINKFINPEITIIDYASGENQKQIKPLPLPLIDCGLGSSPFGTPEFLKKINFNKIMDKISGYPQDAYSQKIAGLLKQQLGLKTSQISVNNSGSFATLNFVFLQFLKKIKIITVGPFFANTFLVWQKGNLPNSIIQPPIDLLPEKKLQLLEGKLKTLKKEAIVYLDNPNNPTGQLYKKSSLEKLIRTYNKVFFVIDEAFGDFIALDQSAASLTEKYPNLLVIRSLSKGLGLAGLRLGYVVVPEKLWPSFHSRELIFNVNLPSQIIAENLLARQKEVDNFLRKMRLKTGQIKKLMLKMLAKYPLKILPTHPNVPISAIKGPKDFYYQLKRYQIMTEMGSAYSQTHRDFDDSLVRMRIPGKIEVIKQIDKRLEKIFKR